MELRRDQCPPFLLETDQLIEFRRQSVCRACALHEQATTIGIPSRASNFGVGTHDQALVVIGEAPGYYEDTKGECWVGKAGRLLHDLLRLAKLPDYADIYLANACRCRPPQNMTPSGTQVRACYPHLIEDIVRLFQQYDGRLLILCAGATATKSVLGLSLSSAFQIQGRDVLLPDSEGSHIAVPAF